jgi:hypothetical protein
VLIEYNGFIGSFTVVDTADDAAPALTASGDGAARSGLAR